MVDKIKTMTTFFLVPGLLVLALPLAFAYAMHQGFKAPRVAPKGNPSDFDMDFERVEIPVIPGQKLVAWHLLATPTSSAPYAPTLIIIHGWGANGEMMLPLAKPFYEAGINCLMVDARNHGLSSDSGISSLPQFAQDTSAAIEWLRDNSASKDAPLALLGHSVGAGAVLLAASERDDIDAVISLSSFAHPLLLMQRHLQRPYKSLFFLRLMAPVVMSYTQWIIGHKFDDIAPMNALCSIKCPVLLVHGTSDTVIPLSDMRAIENNCPDKTPEILLIEGAGHESIDKVKEHEQDLIDFLARSGIKSHVH